MDAQTLYNQISFALGDTANDTYSLTAVQNAAMRAIYAYSQYKPNPRRMGTGNTVQATSIGATTIYVVGGWFNVGDVLILDNWLPTQEEVTVSAVSRYIGSAGILPTLPYLQLTVSPTIYAHSLNGPIQETNPGLMTQPGRDTYPLPYDFRKPDQSSFDMAVGVKLYYEAQNAYYDASTVYSALLSGVGFGESTNFGPSGGYGYPVAGNINDNPNGIPGGGASNCGQGWRFVLSDSPYLYWRPTPFAAVNYDFFYLGCHTIETASSTDTEIVVAYACYAAIMSRAAQMNEGPGDGASPGDVKIENYEQTVSKNVIALQKLADQYLCYFNKKVNTAYVTSG